MFQYKLDILNDGRVHKISITHNAAPLCYADTLDLWQHDESFRSFFISILTEVPFSAYCWETPPVTLNTLNRTFEFVLLDSPSLIQPPDTKTFESYFTTDKPGAGIVVFENLGKDAVLVVPSPRTSDFAYAHLAAFTRNRMFASMARFLSFMPGKVRVIVACIPNRLRQVWYRHVLREVCLGCCPASWAACRRQKPSNGLPVQDNLLWVDCSCSMLSP